MGIPAPRISVVVADDQPFFRDGVSRGLAQCGLIDVVAQAEDGLQAIELIREHQPAVAVLDYQMPGMDGLAVLHVVSATGYRPGSCCCRPHRQRDRLPRTGGGRGGLPSKDSRRAEIVDAVQQVAEGHTVVPASLAAGLASQVRLRAQSQAPVLSDRERQVLVAFADGKSIPTIAGELFLAPSTVKTHTQRLYEKRGVSDRAAAVAEAMRQGILQ